MVFDVLPEFFWVVGTGLYIAGLIEKKKAKSIVLIVIGLVIVIISLYLRK